MWRTNLSAPSIALHCTSARRHTLYKPEQKNILRPPRVLTKTRNWPNIPKKLALASILKMCQFFTSVPNGTSGCFWKRGILISKRTQSKSTLSFHVCTSISRTSRIFKFWHTRHVYFVIYLPILLSLVIFLHVTYGGHRRDRNVLPFKNFLISVNATISLFYIIEG